VQGDWIQVIDRKILNTKFKILSVALYGCETWSLTLREEHFDLRDRKQWRTEEIVS
jgi:hypothetical protein